MRRLYRSALLQRAPSPAPTSSAATQRESCCWVCGVHSTATRHVRLRRWHCSSSSSSSSFFSCASASPCVRTFSISGFFLHNASGAEKAGTAEGHDSGSEMEKKAPATAESPPASSSGEAPTHTPSGKSTGEAAKATSTKSEADPNTNATTTSSKPHKKEEKQKEKEPTPAADEDTSFSSFSTAEARLKDERFRDAETTLRVEEVFAQDAFQRFIHTTEVSTTEGLRWLDVSASPAFFADPLMARVPEGQFAYSVMRKLFGSRFPIGVYASVASGAALPATYVDENWACLILRSTKERSEGGEEQQQQQRRRRSSSTHQHRSTPADYDIDRAVLSNESTGDYAYDEATNEFYPQQLRVSQRLLRGLKRRWEKEEALKKGISTFPPSKSDAAAAAGASKRRRHRNSASGRSSSSSPSSSSLHRSPLTMSEITDRLTIFIGKELHPVEKDPDAPGSAAPSPAAGEAPVLSLNVDRTYAPTRRTDPQPPATTAASSDTQSESSKKAAAAAQPHYEVRWRVITVHRSPISFIREMQSQWNKLTSRGGRAMRTMRTVPAHNHPAVDGEDAIKQALRRAARPAYMADEEDDEDGYSDGASTMVDRVEGWEDLVRLLYHGAARTLQESAYRNTRRLEVMETEIFDATEGSAQHLHSMTRLMAELHLLSREATLHNAILRESKVAYQKLKRVLDHQVGLADQRELLYVDSVLSISSHLEEQSESLLFLQFSVAMNQTEQHLRTLTIFNTIFIPLDFICTCCGSNIFASGKVSQSTEAMYAAFGLMCATTVVTIRWIRRNLR